MAESKSSKSKPDVVVVSTEANADRSPNIIDADDVQVEKLKVKVRDNNEQAVLDVKSLAARLGAEVTSSSGQSVSIEVRSAPDGALYNKVVHGLLADPLVVEVS